MTSKFKILFPLPAFLKNIFSRKKTSTQPYVEKIQSKRRNPLDPAKKAELEKLCEQLFSQKKHITSGKFQFIGLTKIRKKMGKKWAGLCKLVYDTAEEAIAEHTSPGDLSIRYKDDTYVIVFSRATLEEGRLKAALIAEDIQKKLFELNDEDLKDIEIRKAIREIRTDFLQQQSFPDFLDTIVDDDIPTSLPGQQDGEDMHGPGIGIEPVEVSPESHRYAASPANTVAPLPENIAFCYMPLWDVPRNALTTYLCTGYPVNSGDNLAEAHKNFYRKLSPEQKSNMDMQTLQHVMAELETLEKDGRQLLIACPVHYETVYRFENYEFYKNILEKIPASQKQYLVFVIINTGERLPPKNAYWFAAPLRAYGRHVFAEVPLRRDVNFNYLRNTGVDVVGVRLDDSAMSEHEIINILNGFAAKAKALKIPKTFAFEIPSLSLTTSAVCAGFDFLGGAAIHDAVGKPDTIHKYRHEDLLSALIGNEKKIKTLSN